MDYEISCKLDIYKISYSVASYNEHVFKCNVSYDYNYFMNTKLCALTVYDRDDTAICDIKEKRKLLPYKKRYDIIFRDGKKLRLQFRLKKDTEVESSDVPLFNHFKWRKHNSNYTLLVPHADGYTTAAECSYEHLDNIHLYIHDEYTDHSAQILPMLFVMITENLDKPNIMYNIGI
ncbi:hypothetical protein ACO0OL_000005 [Hanseniaspora opuntiae]